jgi:hypothetical protein
MTVAGRYVAETGIFTAENSMRPAHFLKKNLISS